MGEESEKTFLKQMFLLEYFPYEYPSNGLAHRRNVANRDSSLKAESIFSTFPSKIQVIYTLKPNTKSIVSYN